ncbi:MAG TPA: AMP-binding protein [Thermoanaerobaculia bacterium]|nr:AMP-binding protein [Thermoanaerobaculia bacterium]
MTDSLSDLLVERAASQPDAVAFVHEGQRLTYRELSDDAGALASGLFELGVHPGDRVAMLLPAGLDWVRAFWAIQRAGAVSCAFNPYVPPETAIRRAALVRPKLTLDSLAQIPREVGVRPHVEVDPESLAFLQPTSGTSGESRAVMIRHRNVLSVMRSYSEAFTVTPRDVLVSWVPPWHDLGLVRFMIGTVFNGASCHIITPSIQTIPRWLQTITEAGGTITGAPDFAYRMAARLVDPATVDLSSVRWMANGGEPVRRSTIEMFESRFGRRGIVCPGYGLAEATLGVTFAPPGREIRVDDRGNVGCGTPLRGVEVKIEHDEILVRSNGVFAGYFDAEEATAEVLRDGWLHTGDFGHAGADGELYILGRKRAMLKRGGAVLAPRELEEAAQSIEGVRLAAAVGLRRVSTEEIVVAIEIDPRANEAAIVDAVSREVQRTIGFAPERVVVVKIPRTYNGKIRHAALCEQLSASSLLPSARGEGAEGG